jgi:hypothetical protein
VKATALYLGLSPWSIRALDAAGKLSEARVRPPAPSGRDMARVLYDRLVLDAIVARWRQS